MLVSGKRLSDELVLDYVRKGEYSRTLEGAIKRFGAAFISIQQVPKEIEEKIPPDEHNQDGFMLGLYVPNS